jgi:hypothetical protein
MSEYLLKIKIEKLEQEVKVLRTDLTSFAGSLMQSGIMELVSNEDGTQEFKINKVALVDESV